ncbi:hypothetical protein Nmel_008199 [Mimus melanotis]
MALTRACPASCEILISRPDLEGGGLFGQGDERPSGMVTVWVVPLDISVLTCCSERFGDLGIPAALAFPCEPGSMALVSARAEKHLPALAFCLASKMHQCSPPDSQPPNYSSQR